ncbi:hypothetical protein V8G54_008037 [Vigna mungo]|uniref:t-SNARE coiled-coil homology domain-containing protein n=1 Tax=Vigna mungo TaxID=3915 RepID=A0AAQ3P304_VIGMU
MKVDGEGQPLLQQQQQEVAPLQDSYMQSRAEALQNVESTIHELSNIFNQLATLVSQQGEVAIRFLYFSLMHCIDAYLLSFVALFKMIYDYITITSLLICPLLSIMIK